MKKEMIEHCVQTLNVVAASLPKNSGRRNLLSNAAAIIEHQQQVIALADSVAQSMQKKLEDMLRPDPAG